MSHQNDPNVSWKELLEASQLEIQRLREENRQLRRASSAFGQLAERLNLELQRERRRARPSRCQSSRAGSASSASFA